MNARLISSASGRMVIGTILLMSISNSGHALDPSPSPSSVINVAPGALAENPDDSICSLREAINNANSDSDTSGGDCPAGSGADTIVLAAGSIYSASDAITSLGPGGMVRSSALPPITSEISIVGNGATIQREGAASMRILLVGSGGIVTIDNLVIKGGLLSGADNRGAGLLNEGLTVVRNSTIIDNHIVGNGMGAGAYNQGGVIFPPLPADEQPTLIFSNSTIAENSISGVSNPSIAGGGGIYNQGGSFTRVENSTVRGNSSQAPGGGIYHFDTVFEVFNSTISDNTVDCSNFAGEPAGAGVYNEYGFMRMANSTVSGNHADCSGGVGAGIVAGAFEGRVVLSHTTVTRNNGAGGKALLVGYAVVDRSVILGNESVSPTASDCGIIAGGGGTFASMGFNVVGDGKEDCPPSGPGDVPVDPSVAFTAVLDAALADNGGPTFTHALLDPAVTGLVNAAVDRIYRSACTELADQRGESRPRDGDDDADARCDSGAYELDGAPPSGGTSGCEDTLGNEPTWEGTALTSVSGLVTLVRIPCGLLRIQLYDVMNLQVLGYFIQDEETRDLVDISQYLETIVDDEACTSNQGLCVQSTWSGEGGPFEDVYVQIAAADGQVREGSVAMSVFDAIGQVAEFNQASLDLVPKVLPSEYDIFSFEIETGIRRRVTSIANRGEFNPDWSRSGDRIVYDVVRFDPFGEPLSQDLFITNVETGTSAPLIGGEGGNDASWSPTGDQILFDDTNNLYLVSARGGNRQLVRSDGVDGSWYKKNRVFVYQRPSDKTIRAYNMDSGTEVLVASGTNPVWSKNGKYIAYAFEGDLYVIDVDQDGRPQSVPRQLTSGPSVDTQPTWSQNSKRIYFHSDRNGDFDLYSVATDNGGVKPLTGLPGVNDFDPATSNGGDFVAFSSVLSVAGPANQKDASARSEAPAEDAEAQHQQVRLEAYPNPFNPAVVIRFSIPEEGEVSLDVYDVTGRLQARLISGQLSGGQHEVSWNAANLPSGVYFTRLRYGNRLETKAILMTK